MAWKRIPILTMLWLYQCVPFAYLLPHPSPADLGLWARAVDLREGLAWAGPGIEEGVGKEEEGEGEAVRELGGK